MKISLKSDMRFPGFKILDRYILRRFLQTYAFAIAMITVVLVVFDYAERVDDFTELKAPFSAIIFDYYLNFVPDFINQYSGLFTFIAVIFFTSKMAYQTEIIAMLSGGMSFMRLMWPYFLGALVITLLSLALNLWVIPVSQISCVEFEQKYFKSNQTVQYDRHIYRQIEPGEFVYVRGFNRSNRASYMALERYEGTSIAESLEASDVTVDPETGRWHAQRYILRHITPDGEGGGQVSGTFHLGIVGCLPCDAPVDYSAFYLAVGEAVPHSSRQIRRSILINGSRAGGQPDFRRRDRYRDSHRPAHFFSRGVCIGRRHGQRFGSFHFIDPKPGIIGIPCR